MEVIDLTGSVRAERGKGQINQLRGQGFVPGVMYGNIGSQDNIHFKIDSKELATQVKFPIRQNQLYRFHVQTDSDKKSYLVFIKDRQMDVLKIRTWDHVDLYAIDEKQKVTVPVPLKFTGKCVGVFNGGVLQPVVREVAVEALPLDVPDVIEVDVEKLDIGKAIHINDITPPPNAGFYAPSNYVVVTVAAPQAEEEVAAPAIEGLLEGVPTAEGEAAAEGGEGEEGEEKAAGAEADAGDKKKNAPSKK